MTVYFFTNNCVGIGEHLFTVYARVLGQVVTVNVERPRPNNKLLLIEVLCEFFYSYYIGLIQNN